jgi:cytochrome b6-f complex iron-sulfur subunit
MTRREFLYYVWAASILLAGGQSAVALLWFAYPRFRAGTFGGVFEIDISQVPAPDAGPLSFADGRFWLVNIGSQLGNDDRATNLRQVSPGIKALYMVCVHLGCLYSWEAAQNRFNCPCHGSMYTPAGGRILGPAARNLDAFEVEVVDADGNVVATTTTSDGALEANPVSVSNAARLRVNTGRRIQGRTA